MNNIAINLENVSKSYRISGRHDPYRTLRDTLTDAGKALCRGIQPALNGKRSLAVDSAFWALKDVSFQVERGDIVGIIGRNGSGKSTLLKILSRITEPTYGCAAIRGTVGSLLEVGTGFHQELTGRENTYLKGAILGMKKAEIDRKFDAIVDFANVHQFIDTPVKRYSTGMQTRLAFAVAAHMVTDVLLVDEVLAVGDVLFQKKCLGKMDEVARNGRTVILVSHNMGAIQSLCKRGIFLNEGQVAHEGDVTDTIEAYYTSVGSFANAGNGRSCFGPITVNGSRQNHILQGDRLELTTTFSPPENISGFHLTCCMHDMQSRPILHLSQDSSSLGYETKCGNRTTISVDLPPLWLNPGVYSLYFKVRFWGAYGKDNKDYSEKFPLSVNGVNGVRDTILHPHAAWSVESQPYSILGTGQDENLEVQQ